VDENENRFLAHVTSPFPGIFLLIRVGEDHPASSASPEFFCVPVAHQKILVYTELTVSAGFTEPKRNLGSFKLVFKIVQRIDITSLESG
jgi:hypothetical protein